MNIKLETILSWGVHLFTGLGAIIALLSLFFIADYQFQIVCYLMFASIVIDAFDGTLARKANVKKNIPQIDGALLDNIIDFVNYSLVPAFFIVMSDLLPNGTHWIAAIFIILSSCYQFTHQNAKLKNHCFKGFPSLWNVAVIYFFVLQTNYWLNFSLIIIFAILSFTDTKFPHLYRLNQIIKNNYFKLLIYIGTISYLISCIMIFLSLSNFNSFFMTINLACLLLYASYSIWINLTPIIKKYL